MKNKMLLAALAVAGSLTALAGMASAWECPPSVCGAGKDVEQIVGGIDIMPDPVQKLVRNGGTVLDQTTTRTWNDHVDPTLTSAGERLQPISPPNPRTSDLVSGAARTVDLIGDDMSAKAALVVAIAQHTVEDAVPERAAAVNLPSTDEHSPPKVGLSTSDPLVKTDR